MRAVVAGASGAIGLEFLKLLAADGAVSEVIALSRSPLALELPKVRQLSVSSGTWAALVQRSEFAHDRRPLAYQALTSVAPPSDYSDADAAELPALLDAVRTSDVLISCIGTSRAFAEVKRDMETLGAAPGFEKWLDWVDLRTNAAFFAAGAEAGKKTLVRVSANAANAQQAYDPAVLFSLYPRYQGLADDAIAEIASKSGARAIVLRPGRLDRGDLRSQRQWEIDLHAKLGPGLAVARVAAAGMELLKSTQFREGETVYRDDAEIRAMTPEKSEL